MRQSKLNQVTDLEREEVGRLYSQPLYGESHPLWEEHPRHPAKCKDPDVGN